MAKYCPRAAAVTCTQKNTHTKLPNYVAADVLITTLIMVTEKDKKTQLTQRERATAVHV